jgi:hypothetical protein
MSTIARTLLLASLAALPGMACAADAAAQAPMRDPWVPPAVRQAASAPATRGAALNAQVEKKLRASFNAADADHDGMLTLTEARAANLGMVADHFEQIDARHSGRVSFEDLRRYLKGRGASTL